MLIFSHFGIFCQQTSNTRIGYCCFIIQHPLWVDFNHHRLTGTKEQVLFSSSIHPWQNCVWITSCLAELGSSSIHHWKSKIATVSSTWPLYITVPSLLQNQVKIRILLFAKLWHDSYRSLFAGSIKLWIVLIGCLSWEKSSF